MAATGICADSSGFRHGIDTALYRDVVTGLAKRFSVVALIVAMIATTGGSALAGNRHPACEAKQHDCGRLVKISSCCGGDLGMPGDAGTPAQSRTTAVGGVATAPLPPQCEHRLPETDAAVPTQASPPRLALLDLTTLFACLLI